MNINAALDNFPSTDPTEIYERQIEQLNKQVNQLQRENVALKTRLGMRRKDVFGRPISEIGEIKAEPRELHVSINLQL